MTNNTKSLSPYLELLPKLTNFLVGITLLCYLTGFAISNMYLGSLGIVNLDVLRTRYILVGSLFLLFLFAIFYLIYGLFQVIRKHIQEPFSKLIFNIIWYSIINLGTIYFSVSAVAVLAGSVSMPPMGLPKISQVTPWSEWLKVMPKQALILSALILAFVLLVSYAVMMIVILINPKDKNGVKRTRKQQIIELFRGTKKDVLKSFGVLIAIYIVGFTLLLSSNLFGFLSTNNISSVSKNSNMLFGGWERYFGGITLVYVTVAIFFICLAVLQLSSEKDGNKTIPNNPLEHISSRIHIIALVIIVIMPLYAQGIYPNLPQQVGGGQVIKVELTVSDEELKFYILNPNNQIYLIDRATSSTLFLLVDENTQKYQSFEIPNSSIQSIIYKPLP